MGLVSTRRTITGEGKARLLLRQATPIWNSVFATTFGPTALSEAKGSTVNITSTTTPDQVNFASAHGLVVGDRVEIAGHSDANWNSEWTVVALIPASNNLRIAATLATTGTGGTGRKVPNFVNVRAGMMVEASATRAGLPNLPVYGRITTLDAYNKILYVAEWIGGMPTNGDTYMVNGFVVDLPPTQSTIQVFTPRELVHPLWLGRKASEFYGYDYTATLSWERYLSADDFAALRNVLNYSEADHLILIPHIDQPNFQYDVIQTNPLNLQLFGRGGGHRGFVMAFQGTMLYPFPVLDGYGSNYAVSYGPYF